MQYDSKNMTQQNRFLILLYISLIVGCSLVVENIYRNMLLSNISILVLFIFISYHLPIINGNNELKSANKNTVKYVGAVLEYEPYNTFTEEEQGYGITKKNAEIIVTYVQEAKKFNADIIIAPEYGIQSTDMHKDNIEKFLTFTQYVPDPSQKIVLCNFTSKAIKRMEAMQILSCGAKENKIYTVADLAEISPCSTKTLGDEPWSYNQLDTCPEEGYFIYNTQVVFDRTGAVIARYRKQHLFLEDLFTPGPANNTEAIFVTDFGVAFSLQVCFDIIYETPAYSNIKMYGIKDVAMSTAWIDEAPYYFESGFHNGWSRGLGVNLLVSGYHKSEKGHLGSGIFKGYSQELPNYVCNENSGDVLLVSVVETVPASSLSLPINNIEVGELTSNCLEMKDQNIPLNKPNSKPNKDLRYYSLSHQNLTTYTGVQLERGLPNEILNASVCSNAFCCHISYEYSNDQTYQFFSFSGTIPSGDGAYNLGSQICIVVWCTNSDYNTCANIESKPEVSDSFKFLRISSNNFQINSVYPVANHRDRSLIDNDKLYFENKNDSSALTTNQPIKNLLAMALVGRWYDKDS